MPLTRLEKESVVRDLTQVVGRATSAVAVDYSGLTANKLNAVRKQARENSVAMHLSKLTLLKLASKDTDLEGFSQQLTGPSVVLFAFEEPGSAARLVKKINEEDKDNPLSVKLLSLGQQVLPANELKALAAMPSKEEARALLVSACATPMRALGTILRENCVRLLRVLHERAKQEQSV